MSAGAFMNTGALWTSTTAAAATGGRSPVSWHASGVSIDSRETAPGDLFVAIEGPRFDGHDFVARALAGGAAAAMVRRPPKGVAPDAPLLTVDDTLVGLTALGQAARARTAATVIAVTGSVGKTGTKEALRIALAGQGNTAATRGNLNNEIGVPLSLARMAQDCAFGVFELGMSRPGEIGPLAQLVRPDVSVVTTIEPVHSEFFDTIADIADAKAEIFSEMAGGAAVLNRDNVYFPWLAEAAATAGVARIIGFGAHPEATARLIDCALRPASSQVTAVIEGRTVTYRLPMAGRHWVMNSLAVLAAVDAAGADVAAAAAALARLTPLKGRGQRHRVLMAGGSVEVLDEAYNANPASMRAAIAVLATARPSLAGRRIAVLGDMLELGAEAPRLHVALAAELVAAGIDLVFTTGPNMAQLRDALPEEMRADHADTAAELAPMVVAALRPGDVITVKGSLGAGMGVVVETLLAINGTPRRAANGY